MDDSETVVQHRHQTPTLDALSLSHPEARAGGLDRHRSLFDRVLIGSMAGVATRFVSNIDGLENVTADLDPFILVANHSSRREVLCLPPLLFAQRGGRRIHFVADWNFQLIPGVGWLYRRAEVITTTRKSARPRFLNVLKPLYAEQGTVLERARRHLDAGRPVAIFPEGTINRNPRRLLTGRRGAAQLSLETGVPIVPVGIRLTSQQPGSAAGARGLLDIRIGVPLDPGSAGLEGAPQDRVHAWHAIVMRHIERLSGKAWSPQRGDQP